MQLDAIGSEAERFAKREPKSNNDVRLDPGAAGRSGRLTAFAR
jgi:hypothetical protein